MLPTIFFTWFIPSGPDGFESYGLIVSCSAASYFLVLRDMLNVAVVLIYHVGVFSVV